MDPKAHIVLVTGDPETENAVASALAASDQFAPGVVCRSITELHVCLEKDPAPGVLVDIDPEPKLMLKTLGPVIGAFSGTRFVVLSNQLRNELMFQAMEAGARHFLVKDSIASELTAVLQRLVLNGSGPSGGRGTVVAFLAASGGCGATTLAVNLANELQILSKEPTLLIDLDVSFGAAATYLGLHGDYGIADVLEKRDNIDGELITTTAVAHPESIHVLLSPASTSFSRTVPLAYEHLGSALRACRQTCKYTVVDAPRVPMDAAAVISKGSSLTFVVLQLTVKDIRMARKMLTALNDRDVPPERVFPLVNRYRKGKRTITLQEAEEALGFKPLLVSNDYKTAVRAFNFGRLLSNSAKRSTLRKDLRRLALKVVQTHSRQTRQASR